MSRIGNQTVTVPGGVDVTYDGGVLRVKGPKGQLEQKIAEGVSFSRDGDAITVSRSGDTPKLKANHGLMRSLLDNMVTGVTKGFTRKLEIVGVGYKAESKGKAVVFNLGYSHPITYDAPAGIEIKVDGGAKIAVHGYDKERVGQVAAELRGLRPPDSYKGKGVRYEGEYIRLKAGKAGQ